MLSLVARRYSSYFVASRTFPPMNNLIADIIGVAAAQRTQTMYAVDRNKRPIQLRSVVIRPSSGEKYMDKQAKKLVLSKETLRSLDDQDLSSVVGGTGTVICVITALCHSGLCESAICQSGVVCI
jgi:hypothetical protein